MTPSPATPPVCDARVTEPPFVTYRREFLCKHAPKCPDCGHEQVQLKEWTCVPSVWKCRMCKGLSFAFEPDVSAPPPAGDEARTRLRAFADELRKWWSFDDGQQHTHSWHSREDFIAKKLPALLSRLPSAEATECVQFVREVAAIDPLCGGGAAKYFVTADFVKRARLLLERLDRITRAPGAVV